MMPHVVCPIDGQDDQIQKVTAVISSGSDALRQRLARPEAPARPEFIPDPPPPKSPMRARLLREGERRRGEPAGKFDDDLFRVRLTAVFVITAAITFALAAAFVGITGTVFGGGTPVEPYSTNSGQSPAPFVEYVVALIAGAGVAAIWLTRYYRAVGEKLRVAEQQHQAWEQQGPIAYQALVILA